MRVMWPWWKNKSDVVMSVKDALDEFFESPSEETIESCSKACREAECSRCYFMIKGRGKLPGCSRVKDSRIGEISACSLMMYGNNSEEYMIAIHARYWRAEGVSIPQLYLLLMERLAVLDAYANRRKKK